jgi:glutamate formiminotransferase
MTRPRLVELIPNFSEGRNPSVVAAVVGAIQSVPGAEVWDWSLDADHHRSVVTFAVPLERAADAAVAAAAEAARRIDLRTHRGVHPRIGATDVLPFVPLGITTVNDAVRVAREAGRRIADELGIPVFLYEHAATHPDRRNLAHLRRGGLEGLTAEFGKTPVRTPDFGPSVPHPTAGCTVVGARDFLVAYNLFLGDASNLPAVREIARRIRGTNGGLPGVKALALEVRGEAQLSMNLTDCRSTTLPEVVAFVRQAAAELGVPVDRGELIGLVPRAALGGAGFGDVLLGWLSEAERVVEERL